MNIVPVHMIKGFSQVNFEDGAFNSLPFNGVQYFLSSTNGFMDLLVVEKGKFLLCYMRRENGFNTISNDF